MAYKKQNFENGNKLSAEELNHMEGGIAEAIQHTESKENPHGVTASQIGLGNVPNVATNDQTPTHTKASSLAELTSGEKLSAAFGKIAKAVADLISHLANKQNPHVVTAAQVGLGNVNNTSDANKPVSTAQAQEFAKYLPLVGGEVSGELIVNENFHVRKSFDGIPYRSYVRPTNYALGDEYTTALIHYINGVNNAQLVFNRSGVLLRDNVGGKSYHLYGQHNKPTPSDIGAAASSHNQAASTITAGTFAGQVVANGSGQTPGTSLLRNSKLVSADTNPSVNGEINWTYK